MRRALALIALSILAAASFAHADVTPLRMRSVPLGPRIVFASAVARSGDAPEVDRVTLLRELRAALARQQSRIDRCARAVRMDEDPLRARTRVLVGSVTFARSGRASDVRVERSQGIPAPAEACVIEAVSGLSLSTAPRGTVTFAFTYSVR